MALDRAVDGDGETYHAERGDGEPGTGGQRGAPPAKPAGKKGGTKRKVPEGKPFHYGNCHLLVVACTNPPSPRTSLPPSAAPAPLPAEPAKPGIITRPSVFWDAWARDKEGKERGQCALFVLVTDRGHVCVLMVGGFGCGSVRACGTRSSIRRGFDGV